MDFANITSDKAEIAEDEKEKLFLPLFTESGAGFMPWQWEQRNNQSIEAVQEVDGYLIGQQGRDAKLMTKRQEAYQEGLKQGRDEAFTKESKRIEEALDGLAQIKRELSQAKKRVMEAAEEQILELALAIGKKAILHEITVNREVVMNAIKSAVKKLIHDGDLKIRVNPRDLSVVEEHRPELLSMSDEGGEVIFVKDEKVAPGGCVVESDQQVIEYDPLRQIETMESALRKEALEGKESLLDWSAPPDA